MAINLKQIFTSDSDNIKLDKVNYNFDQIVANGGGPRGPQGADGQTGAQGITGAQGVQGITGPQGNIGPSGADGGQYWEKIQGTIGAETFDTLYPVHDTATTTHAPNVVLGYESDDSEYLQANEDAILTLHRKAAFLSNLRFINEDSQNAFDWISNYDGTNTIVTARFNNTDSNVYHQLASQFKFIDDGTTLMQLDSSNLTLNLDAIFENNVEIGGTLKIASGSPDADKVAVAADNEGTLEWRSVDELGGTAPVGTIVSILPSIFEDNSKFINQETYTITDPDNELVKISVGMGINDYVGWYICNGQTWTNGTFSETVPDLNSFSYVIEDNTNSDASSSQGLATVTNDESNIIGGADIDMNAAYASSEYNITGTVTTTDININQGSGTTFKIKRLPQIIYLGVGDLYWEDAGGDQAPDTTVTYTFTDTDSIVNDTGQPGSYTAPSGSSGQFTVTIDAPAGYYWDALPVITEPNNYSVSPATASDTNGDGYNDRLTIVVDFTNQPGGDDSINFTYSSFGSILLIPESDITFETTALQQTFNSSIDLSSSILDTFTDQPGETSNFGGSTLVVTPDPGYEFRLADHSNATLTIDSGDNDDSIIITKESYDPTQLQWSFSESDWPINSETIELFISTSATPIGPQLTFTKDNFGDDYPLDSDDDNTTGTLSNNGASTGYVWIRLVKNDSEDLSVQATINGSNYNVSGGFSGGSGTFYSSVITIPAGGDFDVTSWSIGELNLGATYNYSIDFVGSETNDPNTAGYIIAST